jgi:very-short-patch-repair endonuclease
MQTSSELKKHKQRLKRKPTTQESYFKGKLEEIGLDYKFQIIIGFYIMDFVIPSRMLNIEIDGSSHKNKKSYDIMRDKFSNKVGFKVIRVSNNDVYSFDYNSLLAYPVLDPFLFRSALGKANSYRGCAIRKAEKKR